MHRPQVAAATVRVDVSVYRETRIVDNGRALTIDGLTVNFAALVLWNDRAKVHLVAQSPDVDENGDRYTEAVIRWARGDRQDPPPEHPAPQALERVEVSLRVGDAVIPETEASIGGSSSEWEASYGFRFDTLVPDAVIEVRLRDRTARRAPLVLRPRGLRT